MSSESTTHCPLLLLLLLLLFLAGSGSAAAASSSLPSHDGDRHHSLLSEEQQQVERFQQYLRVRTAHPNPDYAAAVAFLSDQARSVGLLFQTFEFVPGKPLLLLTWPGADPSLPSILLNSHMDSVPVEPDKWLHPPFAAHRDADGRIYARGAQDDKCLAVQYLEALRALRSDPSFVPLRSIHVSLVPDEEIGGRDGAARFAASEEFRRLKVGFVLDEGQASPTDEFRVFYADRTPWWLIVKAHGAPGHGSKMYDGSAVENLMETMETVARFRDSQFDLVKAGLKAASEVISVNPVYMKAGTPSPTGFVMNMQPSECEAGFDMRLPPTADPDLVRRRVSEEWAPISRSLTYEVASLEEGMVMLTSQADHEVLRASTHALSFGKPHSVSASLQGQRLPSISEKGPIRDHAGRPLVTATNETNPWWTVFNQAIGASGAKLAKPEILSSTTDARFMRIMGIPTLGFSPMANTPILLHEHNEFLKDTVFLKGIRVYENIIRSLSTLPADPL
ncbi:hypothetical protein Taro_031954 [Colocasia esculenta]|uniref:N-acyl-aliphatic-L-amino acid amidohydrolase n=1 Tax=Colocasia esculenta TaxID=4460 RepID=A0A843VRC8_COLES|nr:hypothetical protein [Colocasia esculenta]